MSAEDRRITLKLVVDKEKKKVVFAEADEEFVDILFSFLTLPLGTIIRLLEKQSTLGSLSNLYDSIENLDAKHLETEACRTMLLHPQSAAALQCEDLKLNVVDTTPRKVFLCSKAECCAKPICLGSSVVNARCPHCQQIMNSFKTWPKMDNDSVCKADGHGIFMKGGMMFMISDDLHVYPASVSHNLSLLKKLGIDDGNVLEEITKEIGTKEIINLLQRSLISNAPLTEIFIDNTMTASDTKTDIRLPNLIQIKTEGDTRIDESEKGITMKLLVADNKVFFAESGDDFANLILSFLTLPLGLVIKLLDSKLCIGCVDNLYRSVQSLGLDYIKSEECRDMLLSPKLAPFFGCANSLLKMDELPQSKGSSIKGHCYTCYWNINAKCSHGILLTANNLLNIDELPSHECSSKSSCYSCYSCRNYGNVKCEHGVGSASFIYLNPKSPTGKTEVVGGYAKGPGKFMVSNDLSISPLSPVSISQVISRQNSPISKLVEAEAKIDQAQVLNLLKAALISKTPLSDVFFPCQKRKKGMYYVA